MSSMRAVVAESEPRVRGALCALATQGLGVSVVGEADTSQALRSLVEAQQPDLLIVAWNLVAAPADAAPAEAALARLRGVAEELRIVVLGPRPDGRTAAMRAGADSYLSKVDPPEVVLSVLRSHLEQRTVASNQPGGTS
jgi:DNA-binding NarL/FixJ family response regulator